MMNTTATNVLSAAMAGSTGSIVLVCVAVLACVAVLVLAGGLWMAGEPGGVGGCLMVAIIIVALIIMPM